MTALSCYLIQTGGCQAQVLLLLILLATPYQAAVAPDVSAAPYRQEESCC